MKPLLPSRVIPTAYPPLGLAKSPPAKPILARENTGKTPLFPHNYPSRIHDLNWFKAYRISQDSLNSTTHTPLSQFNIFTDGSQTNQHTGAGFVIYHEGIIIAEGTRRLPPLTMVFQAEITAIQMAAHALPLLLLPTDRFVKKFTDSQATLLAFHNTH